MKTRNKVNNKVNKKINKVNKIKTRKGGASNPRKSCADNRKDWNNVWKSKPGYEYYDPEMLYPGRWNLTGVPVKNGLKGEAKDYNSQGVGNNTRYCDPSNKSCGDNKKDWVTYWSKTPGHEIYNPYTLYYDNPNFEPVENGLTKDDMKSPRSCYDDMDYMKYVNSDDYKRKKEEEVRNATSRPAPYDTAKTLEYLQKYKEKTKNRTKNNQQDYLQYLHNKTKSSETKNFLKPASLYSIKQSEALLTKPDEERMSSLHEYIPGVRDGDMPIVLPLDHTSVVPKTTYKTRNPLIESPEEEEEELLQQEEERQLEEKRRVEREERIQTGIQEVQKEELTHQQQRELEEAESKMEEEVSMIVSHNTRIQCLLDAIQQNASKDKIRFMNCAILKLTITPQSLYLSMVYEGNLSEKEKRKISAERPYYMKNVPAVRLPGQIVYPNFTYRLDTYTFTQYLKLSNIDKKYTFYIVRHGQAMHNDKGNVLAGKLHVVTDTSLTEEGHSQAQSAGEEFYEFLTQQNQKIPTHFFVSDLLRTHETLFSIVTAARKQSIDPNFLSFFQKPIVLPCASELPIKGVRGNCDEATGEAGIHKKLASENYSKCKVNSDGTLQANCNPDVDWETMYLPFYGGKVRGQRDTILGRVKQFRYPLDKSSCRDTSMIALAIYYLTEPQFQKQVKNTVTGETMNIPEKQIDNTLAAQLMDMTYEQQIEYYKKHKLGGRTRKFKMKR